MNDQEDKLKSLEILVSATRNKVDYLLNADNTLDAKAGVMIALESSIVVFYIQSVHHMSCCSFLPVIVLGISAYFLWNVLEVKSYDTGVVDFYNNPKNYRLMNSENLLEQLLSDYQNAFDENSKKLEDKNKSYKSALKLFIVGFVLLIFFI